MKNHLDKYYTPLDIAKRCLDLFNDSVSIDNITEYLEPSAGAGVFLDLFQKPFLAFDIEPENDRITKADFLTVPLEYKKGRAVIGNPPFGYGLSLGLKFFKKAVKIADFVGFVLPISQLDNNIKFYEFDLIKSVDLGRSNYSGVDLHCCFNVYKRNANGLNKKPGTKYLKDIDIIMYKRGGSVPIPEKADYAFCTWGSCGKVPERFGQFAQEHYIIIKNEAIRERVMDVCRNTNWSEIVKNITVGKIETWRIIKHLEKEIPELK